VRKKSELPNGVTEIVRMIRERLALTQLELAEAIGINSQSVSNYENGRPIAYDVAMKYIRLARERGFVDLAQALLDEIADPEAQTTLAAGKITLDLAEPVIAALQKRTEERGLSSIRMLIRDLIERELYGSPLELNLSPYDRQIITLVLDCLHGTGTAENQYTEGVRRLLEGLLLISQRTPTTGST
jgi:DNA-binding XRE family transcriptional regulator